ncbi:hypothetical protein UlMin_001942 [Ulmus minor]
MLLRKNLSILLFIFLTHFFNSTHAARFDIRNNCPFVVWAAAVPGGGRQLNPGQTWPLDVSAGTTGGSNRMQTGDCGGVLQCKAYGRPPNTLAEYALNQYQNLDFFDISLVDGFNVKMDFSPTSPQCTRGIKCTAAINDQCPNELRTQGGCNNPCTVYRTDQYCCNSGNCGPTPLSRFFKQRCPDAYSYPKDDQTSTFTCPAKTIRLDIQNNCPDTIWAAAVPGGGKRLNKGETWTLDGKPETTDASIWARTNCNFDGAGRGKCESGDCNGLPECRANGQPPHTLPLLAVNQYNNLDLFDISLVNGFNVPIEFSPTFENCSRGSKCVGDVNGPCPQELRDPGGCCNPCTVNDQFCCTSGSRRVEKNEQQNKKMCRSKPEVKKT